MSSSLQFSCFVDPAGDISVIGGHVYQAANSILAATAGNAEIRVHTGGAGGSGGSSELISEAYFVGGSGANLIVSASIDAAFTGFYRPRQVTYWEGVTDQDLFILQNGSDFEVWDKYGAIATLTDSTPIGTYTATIYGKDTYNDSSDFTVTVAEEYPGGRLPRFPLLRVTAGTAPDQRFQATDIENYWGQDDNDWTLTIESDGTGSLRYDGTVVAVCSGPLWGDPSGEYVANSTGETDWNSGNPWSAIVTLETRLPVQGFVTVPVIVTGGVLVAAGTPWFHIDSSVPAPDGDEYFFPVFYSGGTAGYQQLHTGLIPWP